MEIKDKRRFNPDGSGRSDEPTAACPDEPEKPEKSEEKRKAESPPFEINFSTFVLSLASSAQINLGLIPHPSTGKGLFNPEAAKQSIDLLGMLEEKTKGNLSTEEEQILKRLLFDLRMQFVEISKKPPGGGS